MAQSSRGRVDQFTKDTFAVTTTMFESVQDEETLDAAFKKSWGLADYVSAHAGSRQMNAMVRAEATARILWLVRDAKSNEPDLFAGLILDQPAFLTELGLLYTMDDNSREIVRIALELMTERPDEVRQYPALAAAICVVHDLPANKRYSRRINENRPAGASSIEIFDFFVSNAHTMWIKLDELPALNLVYVVDVSESIEQLQWAHDRYHTNPQVGDRFFEIEYDYDHFYKGDIKKVTAAGNYCLESIKEHGGVCADQAYFAMSIAKSCGIPSGYINAKGADGSHAWVGFLDTKGRRASWDFDAGRYPQYQNLRGNVVNPQTGKKTSDGRLGILGSIVGTQPEKIHAAMAAAHIVERMDPDAWHPNSIFDLDTKGNIRKVRTTSVDDQLNLLRLVLTQSAGVPSAWDCVTEMAKAGEMDHKQLDVWARAVIKLSGKANQDFSFDFLSDLISGVKEHRQQHELWEWAFGQFRSRPDLAAAARFEQGKLWEKNNKPDMAWLAYQDVLDNFLNDGPMCIDALNSMRELLAANGKQMEFITLLEKTARDVNQPADMASDFASQSNYYKLHRMLITEFERHNRKQEAKQLRQRLNIDD